MGKTLSAALAALTLAGGVLATSAADARPHGYHGGGYYHGGRYYYRDRHNGDAALAAGVVGLALGAALASGGGHSSYYYRDYPPPPRYYHRYYGPPPYAYGYGYPRGGCRTQTYWDPYYDTYVRRSTCW